MDPLETRAPKSVSRSLRQERGRRPCNAPPPPARIRRSGFAVTLLRIMCSLRAGGLPPERRLEPNRSPHVKYRQARRFGPLDLGGDSPRPSDRTLVGALT